MILQFKSLKLPKVEVIPDGNLEVHLKCVGQGLSNTGSINGDVIY